MTIMEIINHLDAVKPNSYSQAEKIKWLNQVEWMIKKEIVDTHEAVIDVIFNDVTGKLDLYVYGVLKGSYDRKETTTKELCETHKADKHPFDGYDTMSSLAKKVIAESPYDKLYIHWLEAQIDYANGEYPKYHNSMTMFNESYDEFAKWYNRAHMPLSHGGWKHW